MGSRSRALCCAVFSVVVVLTLPTLARADFIEVISQTYHIHGFASGTSPDATPGPFSYDETSSSPLSRHDFPVFQNPNPSGGPPIPGGVDLYTTANGSVMTGSLFVEAWSTVYDFSNAGGTADASASITFRPLESQLIVKREKTCCGADIGFASIYDETAGMTVLQFAPRLNCPPCNNELGWLSIQVLLPVDVNHIYTMTTVAMHDYSIPFGYPQQDGARLQIEAVPEASSLAMLSVGFVALFIGLRRRKIDG